MTRKQAHTLSIETSGRIGSIALGAGARIVGAATFRTDHNHAVELLPTIAQLSEQHNVSIQSIRVLCVSSGPGSFTGLRIAVTVARTFALSTGATIIPVPTLDVIAHNVLRMTSLPQHLAVVLDAKRGQVYGAAYRCNADTPVRVSEPAVVDPASWLSGLEQPLHVMGAGISYHRPALSQITYEEVAQEYWDARAESVHALGYHLMQQGASVDAKKFTPTYLRLPEAEENWRAARASQSGA